MNFADSVFVFSCHLTNVLNSKMANVLKSKMAIAVSRRRKQHQFWMAFNALQWPTDLVFFRQVEATNFVYDATFPFMINRK